MLLDHRVPKGFVCAEGARAHQRGNLAHEGVEALVGREEAREHPRDSQADRSRHSSETQARRHDHLWHFSLLPSCLGRGNESEGSLKWSHGAHGTWPFQTVIRG